MHTIENRGTFTSENVDLRSATASGILTCENATQTAENVWVEM